MVVSGVLKGTFQIVGPQDSHKNVIKLVGGGSRADLSGRGP